MGETFGQLVRKHRKRLGWNQETLALQAQLGNRSTVSDVEQDKVATAQVARAIVEAMANADEPHLSRRDLRELAEAYLLSADQREQGHEGVIGLLVPNIHESVFWSRVAGTVEAMAAEYDYRVILCQHGNDIERHYEDLFFFENVVDPLIGIISVPAYGLHKHSPAQLTDLNRIISRLWRRGVPTVFVDRRVPIRTRVPFVGPDNRKAARQAVNTLCTLGHRRIGILVDIPHVSAQQERLAGYQDALRDHRLPYDERLVREGEEVPLAQRPQYYGEYGRRRSRHNAIELLSLPAEERPTAIFCTTFSLALTVREVVEQKLVGNDLSIPTTLSLIGFDDLPTFLDVKEPKIARAHYNIEELGRQAYNKIIDLREDMRDEAALADVVIEPRDLERGGTIAKPPGED